MSAVDLYAAVSVGKTAVWIEYPTIVRFVPVDRSGAADASEAAARAARTSRGSTERRTVGRPPFLIDLVEFWRLMTGISVRQIRTHEKGPLAGPSLGTPLARATRSDARSSPGGPSAPRSPRTRPSHLRTGT